MPAMMSANHLALAALLCGLLSTQILPAAGQTPCSRVFSCDGLKAAIAASECLSISIACSARLSNCYGMTITRSIAIWSACAAAARPRIIGSGAVVETVPIFTIANPNATGAAISVSFTNIILTSHTVQPGAVGGTPLDPLVDPETPSAGIHSITGGVNLLLKAVDLRSLDAGTGALSIYRPNDDTLIPGNLTVLASTIAFNNASNFYFGGGLSLTGLDQVHISATTFIANRGTAESGPFAYGASALYSLRSSSLAIDSSTFKDNYIPSDNLLNFISATVVALRSGSVSIVGTTFQGNYGTALHAGSRQGQTAPFLMKSTSFIRNTGGMAGALWLDGMTACLSASQFKNNTAVAAPFDFGGGDAGIDGSGAMYLSRSNVTGRGLNIRLNRLIPSTTPLPTAQFFAQSIFTSDSTAVFTATTVDASGVADPADITAGAEATISLCRVTFARQLRTQIPVSLAGEADVLQPSDPAGTLDICRSLGPYTVTEGLVATNCTACDAAGNQDCGLASGWSWVPWLQQATIPDQGGRGHHRGK